MYILLTDEHMKDAVFTLSQKLNHIACALIMLCFSLAFKDTVAHKSLQWFHLSQHIKGEVNDGM